MDRPGPSRIVFALPGLAPHPRVYPHSPVDPHHRDVGAPAEAGRAGPEAVGVEPGETGETDETGVAVMRPAGTLRTGTAEDLQRTLLGCLAAEPSAVVVDVHGLEIVDAGCLTVFAAVARHAAAWPGCRIVLAAPPTVADQLRTHAVTRHVTVCGTLAEALHNARISSFGPRTRRAYPPRLASVGAARAFAADACARWRVPEHATMIVRLAVTELVANAVRHARTRADLVLRLTSRYVHVAVRDGDRRPPRLLGPAGPDQPAGRGLLLVDALTAAWGCTPTDDGKVTWATVLHTED